MSLVEDWEPVPLPNKRERHYDSSGRSPRTIIKTAVGISNANRARRVGADGIARADALLRRF